MRLLALYIIPCMSNGVFVSEGGEELLQIEISKGVERSPADPGSSRTMDWGFLFFSF